MSAVSTIKTNPVSRHFFSPQIAQVKQQTLLAFNLQSNSKRSLSSKLNPNSGANKSFSDFSKIKLNQKTGSNNQNYEPDKFSSRSLHFTKLRKNFKEQKPMNFSTSPLLVNTTLKKKPLRQIQSNQPLLKKNALSKEEKSSHCLQYIKNTLNSKLLPKKPAKEKQNENETNPAQKTKSNNNAPKIRETIPIEFPFKTIEKEISNFLPEQETKNSIVFLTSLAETLLKIKRKLNSELDSSDDVQVFLENSKKFFDFEKIFENEHSLMSKSLLLLPNLSLLLVLFALNFVEIKLYKHCTSLVVDAFLLSFSISLSFLRTRLNDLSASFVLTKFLSELPKVEAGSFELVETSKNLRTNLKICRSKLVELVFTLYRSRELCIRLENLSIEAEKISADSFQKAAFKLFESLLRGSCGEILASDAAEPSISYDIENPNFILQPLKIEKFLPEKQEGTAKLTLVLDLDETLIHYEEGVGGGEFLIRPFASEFLDQMSKYYELVIFTASVKEYADFILDRVDAKKAIKHRLYRQHTQVLNGIHLKDLSKLGRDMSKVIIVDNNVENFQLQPENGIYIKTWLDDPNDTALIQLAKVLIMVSKMTSHDVRETLRQIQKKIN